MNAVMANDDNKKNGAKDRKDNIADKISFQNEKFSLSDARHHQNGFLYSFAFL